jgi:hypothetical protein
MADVNKSVEISYRADLKQLLANLKKMPSITEAEAKAMVSGLNKQLRQAEKAAAKAAKTTSKSFDTMGQAAKRASFSARGLRKDFANIDRLSSEASQALMIFSPALGQAAATASTFAGAAESAGRALMVSNPLFLAAAAAAGLAFVAFNSLTGSQKDLEASGQRVADMLKEQERAFDIASKAAANAELEIGGLITSTNDLRNELAQMQGIISDTDFLELQNAQKLFDFEEKLKAAETARVDKLREAAEARRIEVVELNKESKALRDNAGILSNLTEIDEKRRELIKQSKAALSEYNELQKQANEAEAESEAIIAERVKAQAEVFELQVELRKEQEAQAKRDEQRKRRLNAQREALKRQREEAALLAEIERAANEATKEKQSLEQKNFMARAKLESKEAEILANLEVQRAVLEQTIQAAEARAALALSEAETEEQKLVAQRAQIETIQLIKEAKEAQHIAEAEAEKALQALKQQGVDKEIENAEKLKQRSIQTAHELFNAQSSFIGALGDLQAARGKQSEDQALRLFRFNQAAALGDIAFSVAKGIAEAVSLPPGIRAAQIAAVVATGGAQSAAVLAQQPPTADMGMVGNGDPLRPDERMVRVLKGEAVLDRATVDRLGGESGVRSLSTSSAAAPQVVVMQPFKHFDRFIKRNRVDGGTLSTTSRPTRY